ncbi:hypothetical protein [Lachnospira multipara]|uniref:Uncharacterized protein n=1 Tax=Lachnospira multipara TaxID=28051 RepID=A0A1H5S2Q9_9FIRM|nr:hypothetical protein [Lachnospira multipara]SEF44188.1 hypothetical protein SAMN05216537_1025 [Lachnospira multipara]
MDWIQELKELYYKELERRDHISEKMTSSITFLTFICTGHMFIWSKMVELDFIISFFPLLFLTTEIVSVGFTIMAFYYFFRTYFRVDYSVIPTLELIEKIADNLQNDDYTNNEIENANKKMLSGTIRNCISDNVEINNKRERAQYRMNIGLSVSFCSLVFVYAIWIFVINIFTF